MLIMPGARWRCGALWLLCCCLCMGLSGCYTWKKLSFDQFKKKMEQERALKVRKELKIVRFTWRTKAMLLTPLAFQDPFLKARKVVLPGEKRGAKSVKASKEAPKATPKVTQSPAGKAPIQTVDLRDIKKIESYQYDPGVTTQLALAIVLGAGFAAAMIVGLVLEVDKANKGTNNGNPGGSP